MLALLAFYKITSTLMSDILRQRTHSVEVKRYCIQLLEKFGSFSHTRDVLSQLDAEARAEVCTFLLTTCLSFCNQLLIVLLFKTFSCFYL